jgi:hypothetical protein
VTLCHNAGNEVDHDWDCCHERLDETRNEQWQRIKQHDEKTGSYHVLMKADLFASASSSSSAT